MQATPEEGPAAPTTPQEAPAGPEIQQEAPTAARIALPGFTTADGQNALAQPHHRRGEHGNWLVFAQ